jgi:transcriptional regulator with XRE-family HTH domain
MQNQDHFRATLRRYRKQHGISQTELASAAGMAQPTIAGFETGHSNLSTDSMDRIGTALLKLIGDRANRATAALVSYRRCLYSGDIRVGA